jgi:hypothetical protein
MAYGLDQADGLSFIGCQVGVARGDLATEEGDRPATLMKHCTDAGGEGVALDHECTVKIRQLQH